MRKIKIRALYNSKIYPVIGLRYDDVWGILLYIDTPDNWRIYNPTSLDNAPKIILMQFVGIKDKEWVEVYEWDICRIKDTDTEYVDVGIWPWVAVAQQEVYNRWPWVAVAQQEVYNRWPVEYHYQWYGLTLKQSETYEKWFNPFINLPWITKGLEVIWNIYENPELLPT